MYDNVAGYVEGEMSIPGDKNNKNQEIPEFNTLDEPIKETIVSDRNSIYYKPLRL